MPPKSTGQHPTVPPPAKDKPMATISIPRSAITFLISALLGAGGVSVVGIAKDNTSGIESRLTKIEHENLSELGVHQKIMDDATKNAMDAAHRELEAHKVWLDERLKGIDKTLLRIEQYLNAQKIP